MMSRQRTMRRTLSDIDWKKFRGTGFPAKKKTESEDFEYSPYIII
jgi:hypothetical protein